MKLRTMSFAAGAALAATFAAMPVQAQVFYDSRGPYWQQQQGLPPPPPGYGYGRPSYGPPPGYGYGPGPGFGRISCGQGAQIVASQGFRRIAPRECQGRVYRYTAYQRGVAFEVRVSSSTGQITLVRQI